MKATLMKLAFVLTLALTLAMVGGAGAAGSTTVPAWTRPDAGGGTGNARLTPYQPAAAAVNSRVNAAGIGFQSPDV